MYQMLQNTKCCNLSNVTMYKMLQCTKCYNVLNINRYKMLQSTKFNIFIYFIFTKYYEVLDCTKYWIEQSSNCYKVQKVLNATWLSIYCAKPMK